MKYDKETIQLMKIAADNSDVNAQYGLALHYCGINNNTQDLKKAAHWAYKAAEIGTRDVRQLWLEYELWKYKEGEIDEGLFEPIYAPNGVLSEKTYLRVKQRLDEVPSLV